MKFINSLLILSLALFGGSVRGEENTALVKSQTPTQIQTQSQIRNSMNLTTYTHWQNCDKKALKGRDPYSRDLGRIKCVEAAKKTISVATCARIAGQLEYSHLEDQLKGFCLTELSARLTFQQCLNVADSMEYGDVSEESKWNCFKRFEHQMKQRECLIGAQKMKFHFNRERIKNFCRTELLPR